MRISIILLSLVAILFTSPSFAGWRNTVHKDKMNGDKSCYAFSDIVNSTEAFQYPYTGVEAQLGVGTDGKDEWLFIGFTKKPNLVGTDTGNDYERFSTRVKIDDEVVRVQLSQKFGDKFLHFSDDAKYINKILQSSELMIEIDWYGEGLKYFIFSLDEADTFIKKMRRYCKD